MRICRRRKSERGSTLVELVMATVLLTIMASALMASFSYGFFIMQLVRENQRATQVLLEKAETLRLYRWDQVLTPGFVPTNFADVYDPQATANSQGITYNGTVAITNVPFAASYSTNLKQIVITVQWTTTRNHTRTRVLSTLVAKNGLQNYVY